MTLYLDMDGVLVDFEGGIAASGVVPYAEGKQYIHRPRSEWPQAMVDADAAYVKAMARPGFWLDLKPLSRAHDLWDYAKYRHHHVLTALPNRMEEHLTFIAHEKRQSLWRNFDPVFPGERINLCLRHEKMNFAGDGNVLVDDTPANCHEWEEAGGIAIHHRSVEQTLKELRRIYEH